MSREDLRFLVVRAGVDSLTPFAVGDTVTTYELDDPYPFASLPPHSGCDEATLVDYQAAVGEQMTRVDPEILWREDSALHCTCRARRKLLSVLVHVPSARLWVSPRPERLPASLRTPAAVEAWAMHGRPGEAPHLGSVTSCNGCKKPWLVLSTDSEAILLGVRRVHYGATVAP